MQLKSPTRPSSAVGTNTNGILFAMCLALVLVVATVTMLSLALPELSVAIGASNSEMTWIVDAYTVALAATVLPLGAIGDRAGRRHVLVLGTIIFGIAALAAAFANGANELIAARAVMGIGAAMIMPGTLSTITATFPPDQRARGVAVWSGFASGGAIFGMLVSGILLEFWGWESIFVFSAIVAAAAAIASVLLSPNTSDDEHKPLDFPGSISSAIGIGALVFGIVEGAERGWTNPVALAGFGVAALGLLAYVLWDLRAAAPLLDPRYFRLRGFSSGTIAVAGQFLGLMGFFYVGLQFLQLILGYSPLKSAIAMLPVAAVILPMSSLTPRIVVRFGTRTVVSTGLLVLAGSFLVCASLSVDSGYPLFLVALILGGLGIAWAGTPSTTAITASLPASKQGVASAVNDTTREVGSALGIAIAGSIYASSYESSIHPTLASLPPDAAGVVEGSAAGGLAVAARAGEQGATIADAVRHAFISGLNESLMVCAVIIVAVAVVVWALTPGQLAARENQPAVHSDPIMADEQA